MERSESSRTRIRRPTLGCALLAVAVAAAGCFHATLASNEIDGGHLDGGLQADIGASGDGGAGDARDGLVMDSGAEVNPSAVAEHHPACLLPAPTSLPAYPDLGELDDEEVFTAALNSWQDIDCSEATIHSAMCSEEIGCAGIWPYCLRTGTSPGVCAQPLATGPGTVPLSFRDGFCRFDVDPNAKANACCRQLPGFDCRTYPFEILSRPGQACRRHGDCEAGLVCTKGGVCACPGVSETAQPTDCADEHELLGWGRALARRTLGSCFSPALGFAADVIEDAAMAQPFAALAPDGSLHVVYESNDFEAPILKHAYGNPGSFERETLPRLDGVLTGAVIDRDGFLRLAFSYGVNPSATNRSGALAFDGPDTSNLFVTRIALAPDGTPHLAFEAGGALYLATPTADGLGWVSEKVEEIGPQGEADLRLVVGETQVTVIWDAYNIWSRQHDGPFVLDSARFETSNFQAALGSSGVLWGVGDSPGLGQAIDPFPFEYQYAKANLFDVTHHTTPEVLYQEPLSRFTAYESTRPFIVSHPSGSLAISYITPEGRMLRVRQANGDEQVDLVTSSIGNASLAFDASGEPHLFVSDDHMLLHIFRGVCP